MIWIDVANYKNKGWTGYKSKIMHTKMENALRINMDSKRKQRIHYIFLNLLWFLKRALRIAYNECTQRLGNIADMYYQTKDTK